MKCLYDEGYFELKFECKMARILCLIAIIIATTNFLPATEQLTIPQEKLFEFTVITSNSAKSDNLNGLSDTKEITSIKLNSENFSNILKDKPENINITQFPITSNEKVDFEMQLDKNSASSKTKIFVYTDEGKKQIATPQSVMYSGKIKGDANSFVSFIYSNNLLFAYIKQGNGNLLSISPTKEGVSKEHFLAPHIQSADLESGEAPSWDCLTEDHASGHSEIEDNIIHKNDELQAGSELLNADIICEGSYDYYELMNKDLDKATAYIVSVMELTSKLYVEFINVQLTVSEIHIRQTRTSDPYQSTSHLGQKLFAMPNVWKKYESKRALVVLFANLNNQPSNSVVAGISMGGSPNVGSLCSVNRGYCVLGIKSNSAYPTFQYTWGVNVAAHEMGHNFSAPHTHNCYFSPNMIDTCVTRYSPFEVGDACVQTGTAIPRAGTIMSYCHTTNSTRSVDLVFHPRVIPLMRRAAENASCVNPVNSPTIELLAPLGQTRFRSGEEIEIRWSSEGVSEVNIYLSIDNGETWNMQANGKINAEDSILVWEVPDVITETALIKIVDAYDTDLYDESILPFEISYQEIIFEKPVPGESFSNEESFYVLWKQNFKDNLKLELSTDGGTSWRSLTSNTDQIYYDLELKDIESDNCILRLTSLEDGTTSESSVFSVGEPYAKIISPNGSEKIESKSKFTIKWESKNLNQCFLEYSTNNGQQWMKANFSSTDAYNQEYEWNTPSKLTDSALVRIIPAVGNKQALDYSDNMFSIIEKPVSVENNQVIDDEVSITAVTPNPLDNSATISINNSSDRNEECSIMIVDELGKNHFSVENIMIPSGDEIRYGIEVGELSQGSYFIVLRSSRNLISYPIKIIR